jgi:two-component system response regulator HydG
VPADDHARIFRLLATSLQILAAPLPSADAAGSPAGENRPYSPAMRHVMALAARVAPLDSTVLITGESGVGKERLARWLHRASPRAHGPFVAVNCGAFADTLLESELFGHARGAFTGAVHDRLGVFEAATSGTLFLDEIGEVSPAMQVRLLRVLQEREVIRLGETKVRPVDVRLIAATNRDLLEEVAHQRYRRDLYYRLRVIDLHVPPLRERPEELLALASDLLAQTAARLRRPVVGYTPRALECLLDYLWPGNIRELEHAIERACAVATGPAIDVEDLPAAVRGSQASARKPVERPLADREIAYIQAVLDRYNGNRRRAAEDLGMSLSTLKRRLRRRTRTP